ncbi:uncharacterized protein LOC127846012 [Dreissena polymorpha]|nr:uncharacterized protein LOC127846012 [Dreissena polymorpha]
MTANGTNNKKSGLVTWRCSSRCKAVRCPFTVSQRGDHFVQKREHLHAAVPNQELRHRAYSKARALAKTGVFIPSRTISENILTEECGKEDVARSRVNLLKRAMNHARARLRPKEPDTLDFEVDADIINADVFPVKDIQCDSQRHFVFATEYQLYILRQAKRWFMDGTFKRSGQLFTINAFVEREGASKQLPLVFVLMSRRTQADNEFVFRAVMERVGNVEVEGIVADFEVSF